MRRQQLAAAYLQTVRNLHRVVERDSTREARERAVKKFRADVNPIIHAYTASTNAQSISNEFSSDPSARGKGEAKVLVLFNAVNGLARAGKDAAAESPELSAHYLQCAIELGQLWSDAMSGDTDV